MERGGGEGGREEDIEQGECTLYILWSTVVLYLYGCVEKAITGEQKCAYLNCAVHVVHLCNHHIIHYLTFH